MRLYGEIIPKLSTSHINMFVKHMNILLKIVSVSKSVIFFHIP